MTKYQIVKQTTKRTSQGYARTVYTPQNVLFDQDYKLTSITENEDLAKFTIKCLNEDHDTATYAVRTITIVEGHKIK